MSMKEGPQKAERKIEKGKRRRIGTGTGIERRLKNVTGSGIVIGIETRIRIGNGIAIVIAIEIAITEMTGKEVKDAGRDQMIMIVTEAVIVIGITTVLCF